MQRETLVLTADDVDAVFDIAECIDVVEDAFHRWGIGQAAPPAVLGVHVPDGGFHVKAAAIRRERSYFAAKTNANFPSNPSRHGLPSIQGVVVLFDCDDGVPLAVIDSIRITELRTAAATAVAARRLSREGSEVVTLVGCGAQARSQLEAVAAVRAVRRVWVVDRDAERAARFARRMSSELGVPIDVGRDVRDAVARCDICITCTTSRVPLIEAGDVRPGLFLAAVGADNPEKHEIAPLVMRDAKVVADSLAQCSTIGDLHHAIEAGVMTTADVYAELSDVVADKMPGRVDDDEVIVFDSTGTALQDVAAAAAIYVKAQARGRGMVVGLAGKNPPA